MPKFRADGEQRAVLLFGASLAGSKLARAGGGGR